MTDARHRALLDAYLTTRYVAYDGALAVECRPGTHEAAMDRLLERHGASGGVFITAWNPRSVAQSAAANAAAHRRLAAEQNLLVLPGSMFGPQQEGFVRCAFANVEAALMPEVARRLAASSGRAG